MHAYTGERHIHMHTYTEDREHQTKYIHYIHCSPTNLPLEGLIIGPDYFQYPTRFRTLQKNISLKTARSLSFSVCYSTVKINYNNYTHFSILWKKRGQNEMQRLGLHRMRSPVLDVCSSFYQVQLFKAQATRILRDHPGPRRPSLHTAGCQHPAWPRT